MKSNKILGTVLMLMLGSLGCGNGREPATETAEPIAVTTVPVSRSDVSLTYTASGTLKGSQSAVLTSKAPGYVQAIRFQPGERVRAGQVLFVLEDAELGARLQAARAGVAEARQAVVEAENGLKAARAGAELAIATYERFKTLRDQRAVAPQEFDEVEAKYQTALAGKDMAAARAQRARSALERAEAEVAALKSITEVAAPFAGEVTRRLVDIGNLAGPGTPLGVIEKAGGLRAEVSVPEAYAGKINGGDNARVWLEGAGQPLEARISEVHQGVDVRSRAFLVAVDLPAVLPDLQGVGLQSGRFVRVGLDVGRTERTLVPFSAVVQRGQLEMVFVVEDHRARVRLVTLGKAQGEQIEVLSGLSEGELLVRGPTTGLRDGHPVVTQ